MPADVSSIDAVVVWDGVGAGGGVVSTGCDTGVGVGVVDGVVVVVVVSAVEGVVVFPPPNHNNFY